MLQEALQTCPLLLMLQCSHFQLHLVPCQNLTMEALHLLRVFANAVKIAEVEEEEAAVKHCKVKNGSARFDRGHCLLRRGKTRVENSEGPKTCKSFQPHCFAHVSALLCPASPTFSERHSTDRWR